MLEQAFIDRIENLMKNNIKDMEKTLRETTKSVDFISELERFQKLTSLTQSVQSILTALGPNPTPNP